MGRRRPVLPALIAAAALLPAPGVPAASAPHAAGVQAHDAPLYAIVHVDIEPAQLPAALPILQAYAAAARHDATVLRLDVLQQDDARNHFTLVEAWRSRRAFEQFAAHDYVKSMRTQLQPLLGSPFDERLHRALTLGATP